jgi:hypothetical protein
VCFVGWRIGSLIHGSRGFAEREREWAWSGCSQLILLVAAADVLVFLQGERDLEMGLVREMCAFATNPPPCG